MASILIVDDDALARTILLDAVRALGHTATGVGDGMAGLAVLRAGGFDVLLTDVRMPGMDGIELARRVKLVLPALPIALMSADTDFIVHEEALSRGVRVQAFLQKPFAGPALARVLHQLTGTQGEPAPAPSAFPIAKDDAPGWLEGASGPASRLNPLHVWFVASRRRATGRVIVSSSRPSTVTVGVVEGALGPIEGLPEGVAGTPARLVTWMLEQHNAEVRFDLRWRPEFGAPTRPVLPSVALAGALASTPHAVLEQSWKAVLNARAFARTPKDTGSHAWALEPFAMEVHAACRGQRVSELAGDLARRDHRFRNGGFRVLELLARLRLLTLLA